jgi:hypothetical protein
MLNAGIEINDTIVKSADEVRGNLKDYAVFKIKNNTSIDHVKSFPESSEDIEAFNGDKDRENNWSQRVYGKLFEMLKNEREPVYVVLDFRYVVDSQRRTKLYFIGWCPEKASVKQRMLFASTFRQFADKINIPIRFTAHSVADITYEEILAKAERF